MPWLKQTKDTCDFFDFHVYDVSPEDFAVQTEMVANEARLAQGRDLPIWITESNTNLKPGELNDPKAIWQRRFLPYERLLLRGMLPQADKLAGNLYHDLHAKSYTLLPRGADDPDPMYWLFWIMRDLRGRRIVADSSDPEVLSFATLEEDCVTVVLFNDSAQAKQVPLSVSMHAGWWTGPDIRAVGEGPQGGAERLALKADFARDGGKASATLALPPHATVSINFRLDNFATPAQTRKTEEHFGDRTLQFIGGPGDRKTTEPVSVTIAVPQVAPGAKVALRLGLLGPEGTEPLTASFNGKDLPIKATALQEVSLDPAAIQPKNEVKLWLRQPVDNPKLALGFAAVVVETVL